MVKIEDGNQDVVFLQEVLHFIGTVLDAIDFVL